MGEQFLMGLGDNFGKLGQALGTWFGEHGLNILVILLGAWLMRHFSAKLISQAMAATLREDLYPTRLDREKRLTTLDSLVGAIVRIAVYVVAAVMIVAEIGINTGPLLASAGVLGVALGFGAQSLIKDLVSGIFIIIENQYRVSDVVRLGDVTGVVEAITIRTTIVRDLSGDVHHIPNGTIGTTTNKTMDFGRLNEDIVVSLDTDLDQLEHVVNHVGEELAALPEFKHRLHEPPQLASFRGFSGGGLVVKILGKTSPGNEWRVRSELYRRLARAFDKNGIMLAGQSPKKK